MTLPENIKYIYYQRNDGIGTQYRFISRLLHFVIQHRITLLLDLRGIGYFCWDKPFSIQELNSVFSLKHANIIYNPDAIEAILADSLAEVIAVNFESTPYPSAYPKIPVVLMSDLSETTKGGFAPLYTCITLAGEYAQCFNRLQPQVSNCIGIHYRSGNGEQHILLNKEQRQRLDVDPVLFFDAMDKFSHNDFFVCTDTPDFLATCKERYPGRIYNTPFTKLPAGYGPGHLKPLLFKKIRATFTDKENTNTAESTIDGYALLGAALTEMLLLGECAKLICNESSFTFHARRIKKVPTRLLQESTSNVTK